MHTATSTSTIDVSPGEAGAIDVAITNTSEEIDAFHVDVLGLDPDWVTVTPIRLPLFPGESGHVRVQVELPDSYPASRRTVTVNVGSEDDPDNFSLAEVELEVQPAARLAVELDPVIVNSGRRATFGILVTNHGNTAVDVDPTALDPEDLAEFEFDPPGPLQVPPGRTLVVQTTAQGGRAWFGQPRARIFTLGVTPVPSLLNEELELLPAESTATFIQRPRISRWIISLIGLLLAVAVFAFVLYRSVDRTLGEVIRDVDQGTAVLEQALSQPENEGAQVPINAGDVIGKVTLATIAEGDAGIGGIQVELFDDQDTSVPVAAGTTDDDGNFALSDIGPGTYKLKLSGAGVETVWYPAAMTPADAAVVLVAADESMPLEIVLGGKPVTVSGSVEVEDTTDVTVRLVKQGQLDPDNPTDAVVAEVGLSADGSFSMDGVPSPGTFDLVVEKPGAATEIREVSIQPGEAIGDVGIKLQPAEGRITGTVRGPDGGPLGGATITATDGTTTIETVSLTTGQVGFYSLNQLALPGQYTVTIDKEGLAPETRTVSLTENTASRDFSALLLVSEGVIQGNVSVIGAPPRGISVNISGGDVNRTTSVVSQGVAVEDGADRVLGSTGSYRFGTLPVPATYTLTFTGTTADTSVVPQVQIVSLDPNVDNGQELDVDVTLNLANVVVNGIVRDSTGSPAPQATVTLSDGTDDFTFVVQSANDPAGTFSFSNVPPGAYTVTAESPGTVSDVQLVTVSAAVTPDTLNLNLGRQARILGGVTVTAAPDGFDPATDLEIKLYEPDQFPRTALATVSPDGDGNYVFAGVRDITYIVAVHRSGSGDPLDARRVDAKRSQDVSVEQMSVVIRAT